MRLPAATSRIGRRLRAMSCCLRLLAPIRQQVGRHARMARLLPRSPVALEPELARPVAREAGAPLRLGLALGKCSVLAVLAVQTGRGPLGRRMRLADPDPPRRSPAMGRAPVGGGVIAETLALGIERGAVEIGTRRRRPGEIAVIGRPVLRQRMACALPSSRPYLFFPSPSVPFPPLPFRAAITPELHRAAAAVSTELPGCSRADAVQSLECTRARRRRDVSGRGRRARRPALRYRRH